MYCLNTRSKTGNDEVHETAQETNVWQRKKYVITKLTETEHTLTQSKSVTAYMIKLL